MATSDIIRQLQRDILPLQGFKPPSRGERVDIGLPALEAAFPQAVFPTGAVHEFISSTREDMAAAHGFVAGLLGHLMRTDGICIWVSTARTVFPPALTNFGISPDRVIFIDCSSEHDLLWAVEEALTCEGLASVVGEVRDIDFTTSRRLQLAVEKSRVTGFLLRHQPRRLGTVACVTRWRIAPLASQWEDDMPGVGFPRWQVELLKIRNGKPGTWEVEWAEGRFREAPRHEAQNEREPLRIVQTG